MLSQAQRSAILELHAKGVSIREIAQVLRLSRLTVRKVLRSNSTNVPEIQRAEKAQPYREQDQQQDAEPEPGHRHAEQRTDARQPVQHAAAPQAGQHPERDRHDQRQQRQLHRH